MIDDFVESLVDEIDSKIKYATLGFSQGGRMVLGGTSGINGGSGGPPGGFIGQLAQKYVTYDTTEAETLSGTASLVDNLNHIRYRIRVNETDIDALETSVSGIENTLASGVATTFRQLLDTPNSYTGYANAILTVTSAENGVGFSGTEAELIEDALSLNKASFNDFSIKKDVISSGIAPNLKIFAPTTSDFDGKLQVYTGKTRIFNTPSFDAFSENYPGNASTVTFSHTVGTHSNRILIVGVAIRGGVSVSSVTFNGVNLTRFTYNQNTSYNDIRTEVWYVLNPDIGTHDLTVTLNSTQTFAVGVASFYNVGSINNAYTEQGAPPAQSVAIDSLDTGLSVDIVGLQSNNGNLTVGNPTPGEQVELTATNVTDITLGMSYAVNTNMTDFIWTWSPTPDYYSYCNITLYSPPASSPELSLEIDETGDVNVYKNLYLVSGSLNIVNSGVVTNLNADYLDGYHRTSFSMLGHTHLISEITDYNSEHNAVKLQGINISNNTPASGALLRYNGFEWIPTSLTTLIPERIYGEEISLLYPGPYYTQHAPVSGSICIFINGLRKKNSSFTIYSGRFLEFEDTIDSDDEILADYSYYAYALGYGENYGENPYGE